MEVLIGFTVGYWVGTRQGRKGIQETLGNVQAIMAHPQTRKLLRQGMAVAELPLNQGKRGKDWPLAVLRSVAEEYIEHRNSEAA
jgi:hypothetical protein